MQKISIVKKAQFSSIGPISGATSPGQSGPGSDGNKGVLRIPQSSSITGTSPSDCLLGEVLSVYSTALTDWAIHRVKYQTVLFQIIQFSISTQFKRQNSSISSNSV